MHIKPLFSRIIKVLIASDLFLNLGWGLLSPIFALFILDKITNGDHVMAAQVAGFSALFYWITKSLFEIPLGYVLDTVAGEKDDFWIMVLGTLLTAFVPLGFLISTTPWHIYGLQMVHAIGMALALPSWLAIFTRHIDKGKEALEWSMESTSIGLGAGIAGGLGGVMVPVFGYSAVFVMVSGLTFLSVVLLLMVKDNVYPKIRDGARLSATKPIVEP